MADPPVPAMQEIERLQQIRRERLQRILDDRFPGRGGQALLATALNRQTGYVSRCLSGGKLIGEVFARHIEQSLHLSRYWLDGPLPGASVDSPHHAALLERFDALTPSQQSEFLEALERLRRRNEEIIQHLQRKDRAQTEGT